MTELTEEYYSKGSSSLEYLYFWWVMFSLEIFIFYTFHNILFYYINLLRLQLYHDIFRVTIL